MQIRNAVIAALLALLPLALLGAQSATATLNLEGQVSEVLTITVNATNNTGLNLDDAVTDYKVGEITWTTNNEAGYTVTVSSNNANGTFRFAGTETGNNDTLDYTLSVGGTDYAPSSGSAQIADTTSPTGESGVGPQDIEISYDGTTTFLNDGTYEDTLTFSITAK